MTKSSHNVKKITQNVSQHFGLRIHINLKKLLLARGNWIIYNRLPIGIYLYLNILNNDMSITILLILMGLQLSMLSRLIFIIICV